MSLPSRFHVSTSCTLPVANIMPSAREWFDAQLVKDESIAPCQNYGHDRGACVGCTTKWDTDMRSRSYQAIPHVHKAWCPPIHSPYVKMSGLGADIVAQSRSQLRKASKLQAQAAA